MQLTVAIFNERASIKEQNIETITSHFILSLLYRLRVNVMKKVKTNKVKKLRIKTKQTSSFLIFILYPLDIVNYPFRFISFLQIKH